MTTRTHWACGHEATPHNTKPGKRGLRCLVCIERTAARNAEIAREYLGGLSRPQLAEKFDLSIQHISKILHNARAKLPREERRKRMAKFRSKHAHRKPVWPDCPPELREDYLRLRNQYKFPAAKARAMLEEIAA